MPPYGLTLFALFAFAANSVLCRVALGGALIDAASFSLVRLVSGALTLLAITRVVQRDAFRFSGRWRSAAMLFLYAVPFSFAYVSLGAGTGALILFGSVQATMVLFGMIRGERPDPWHWLGLTVALAGLVGLVLPGITAPPIVGSALMMTAGVAWGIYSLQGRGTRDPLNDTTSNFLRAVPLVVITSVLALPQLRISGTGVALAVGSGAIASAIGYVAWYAALRGLTATQAGVVQLAVPVLAAAGGVVFIAENISVRLVISAVLILGGVALALFGRQRPARRPAAR